MPHPLDLMLRTHITPVLSAAGFGKAGRNYWLAADNGDLAVVEFRAWTADRRVVGFYAHAGLVPTTQVDWIYRDHEAAARPGRPGSECELVGWTIEPPPRWRAEGESSTHPLWGFLEAEGGDGCGVALAALLAEQTVPTLVRLLDRRALLAALRDPGQPEISGLMRPVERSEVMLLVDEGPSAELDAVLGRLPADDMVAVWARQRLAQRAAADA